MSSVVDPEVVRSFPAGIFLKACDIAKTYHVTIREASSGGFIGGCVEVRVSVHQPTVEECYRHAFDGVVVLVASMLEDGDTPPSATK